MHGIRIHEFGDNDVLTNEETPQPEPTEEQVLVNVRAAGVNPMDWKNREGALPELLPEEQLPVTLGMDFSGVVEAVGDTITKYAPGDDVFGRSVFPDSGSYAEYTLAEPMSLTHMPENTTHFEAAAVPTVGLTAGLALYDIAEIESGDRILIHGAAGGVGHVAVQLANRREAHTIGTASGYNEEYLRDLGIDEFVNYREQRFEDVLDSVDVVLDTIGGETQTRSFDILREDGILVSAVQPPAEDEAAAQNVEATMVQALRPRPPVTMAELANWLDAGGMAPTVSETYPLSETAAALQASEAHHARGKLVLSVPE